MEIKKKSKNRILITLGLAITLIIIFYLITSVITRYTGFSVSQEDKEEDFKNCIKEKGIVLYINTNDAVKTLKNINVNEYLEFVTIKNCMIDNSACLNSGILNFPAWIINGNKIEKDISVDELSSYTQCKLVK